MITITIKIETKKESENTFSIKSNINEQIQYHLKEKEKQEYINSQLKEKIKESLNVILLELNKEVGENVWKFRNQYNEIGFETTMIRIEIRSERITFGNITYYKPNLNLNTELIYLNGSGYSYLCKALTNLNEVHEIAQKDYIKYFTNKL